MLKITLNDFIEQPLPKEDLERVFVCRGVIFDLLCPTGKKLIFQGVQDGTKLTTSCVSSECCNYSDTDCVMLNRDLSLQTACTAKQYCNEVMLPATDTDKCGNLFPSKNHYHSIEYYCVDSKFSIIIIFLDFAFYYFLFGSKEMILTKITSDRNDQ